MAARNELPLTVGRRAARKIDGRSHSWPARAHPMSQCGGQNGLARQMTRALRRDTMLRFVCENAFVLLIMALMTASIVTLGYALLSQAAWLAY
jgi:hypothetical protein